MCLLVLAWQAAPRYRLAVAANRDEYHERPAQALAKWPEPPGIIAGRDLRASGTWLGVDPERRFGVVTNFRELQPPRRGAPSRGELIPRYLAAPFVLHPEYGTRCSTVLLEAPHGGLYLAERRFDSRGEVVGETEFNLNPGEWP